MLYKLSLNANSIAISFLASIGMCVYTNIFQFSSDDTPDVGLSNSMVLPMELRCCVPNKVLLLVHRPTTMTFVSL